MEYASNICMGPVQVIAGACYAPSCLLSSSRASDLACSLLWSSGLVQFDPLPPPSPALSFLLICSSPIPDPAPPRISCFQCSFCFTPPALNPVLNPKPRSPFHPTSHHVPLFYFHPYAFLPKPMPISLDPVMFLSILIH